MQEDCECKVCLGHIARFAKENQTFLLGGSDGQQAGQPMDNDSVGVAAFLPPHWPRNLEEWLVHELMALGPACIAITIRDCFP